MTGGGSMDEEVKQALTEMDAEVRRAEQAVNAHIRPDPVKKTEAFLAHRQFTTSDPYPHFTDMGNAEWLAGREHANIRFCHAWGRWLIWDGRRWAVDQSGEIERRAKATVQSIYFAAAEEPDASIRKALADHARRSEADGKIQAAIRLAQSEPGIPVKPDQLDADPWLLNCQNGTVDLRTGELRPHNRKDLITKVIPVAFDITAGAPTWEKFLDRIMGGSRELIDFLQRGVGYSLTGDTREQCLFLLHGIGANGKSTFLNVLQAMIADYALQASFETFLLRDRGGIPNDLARLNGSRLVVSIEADAGRRLAESTVKQLTGGDRVAARFLHHEFFEFSPIFKLWLGSNHKPVIRGTDLAIWRRIRLIPFTVTIPPEEQDLELPDKLKAELPGVLAWAVKGCLLWQAGGLRLPEAVKSATQAYREDMDILGEFLADCCEMKPDATLPAAEFYKAYASWAAENGEPKKAILSQRSFGRCLMERGFTSGRTRTARFWGGISLKRGEP